MIACVGNDRSLEDLGPCVEILREIEVLMDPMGVLRRAGRKAEGEQEAQESVESGSVRHGALHDEKIGRPRGRLEPDKGRGCKNSSWALLVALRGLFEGGEQVFDRSLVSPDVLVTHLGERLRRQDRAASGLAVDQDRLLRLGA